MIEMIRINLVVDASTASWMASRVYEDGLMAHINVGFPYDDNGVHVCSVLLDYAVDADNEISCLLAKASERASRFELKRITPPNPVVEGQKNQCHEIHRR